MDIVNIKRLGYFDDIKMQSTYLPSRSKGLIIRDEIFSKNVQEDKVSKLIINLIGVANDPPNQEELNQYRLKNGFKLIRQDKDTREYLIGYIDITILKGKYNQIMYEELGDSREIQPKLYTNQLNEEATILVAKRLQNILNDRYRLDDELQTAIINKVYVVDALRKNGISTWIHENIFELLHQFSTTFISGIVLECGDFSSESKTKFSMTEDEYKLMLFEHYVRSGYRPADSNDKLVKGIDGTYIMYKEA